MSHSADAGSEGTMTRQVLLDDELYGIVEAIERQTGLNEADIMRSALREKLARIDRERGAARRLDELKVS